MFALNLVANRFENTTLLSKNTMGLPSANDEVCSFSDNLTIKTDNSIAADQIIVKAKRAPVSLATLYFVAAQKNN